MTRTIQVPSEAFKPACGLTKKDSEVQSDDMEIDENHDFNAAKARTLSSFYPSSIRASKDLEKNTNPTEILIKAEEDMETVIETDEDKLIRFRQK